MAAKFHVINLGCKVNKVESDTLAAALMAAGAEPSALAEADVILINSCCVTAEADAKSRKALRRALKSAADAAVIVTGCGAVVDAEQFLSISPRCLLIAEKPQALAQALELLGLEAAAPAAPTRPVRPASDAATPASDTASPASDAVRYLRSGKNFNTRVPVKVQDGCDNACSYCIVPRARGRAWSVPHQQVLSEMAALVEAGTRELVLTGIDLGSYQDDTCSLPALLSQALALGSQHRLRLSSIELPQISKELIELMADANGRICAFLHIPLQSGSDAVLAAMNRRYDVAEFRAQIMTIKRYLPQIALSTDIIVGFPGEAEADFAQTLALSRELGFSRIHVFRYSKRPGTAAALMPGQLPAEIKIERAARLRQLGLELAELDGLRRVGTVEQVLVESPLTGRAESYHEVQLQKPLPRGSLLDMKLVGYQQGKLVGLEAGAGK